MTLSMDGIHCLWPRQEDLSQLLYLLNYHPYKNLGPSNHDFPWNKILSLFNDQDISDPDFLKYMCRQLSLEFLYSGNHDVYQNLAELKGFIQFMTPIFSNAIEGDHRIELGNRLLYGIALKQAAPFIKTDPPSSVFNALPFNSTVYKPIQAVVYLPAKNSSALCLAVITHLEGLSRKTAEQKTKYIRDSWRSLYHSIYSALDNDETYVRTLYATQQELYEEMLNARQDFDCKARKNRHRLSEVIADVIFAENPTATLAATNQPQPADIGQWKAELGNPAWTVMDNNPFAMVSKIGVCFIFVFCYELYFSNKFGNYVSSFFLSPGCHKSQCRSTKSA